MKALKLALLLVFPLQPPIGAEEARFFRVAGPVTSAITTFGVDGYVTWTNAPTNTLFTVQVTQAPLSPTNTKWVDYIQVPATNPVTTHRLYDPHTPANMAFIPAGSFQMGDNLDGDTTAQPTHRVFVSGFYMDRTEVTKALWDEVQLWSRTNSYDIGGMGRARAASHPVQQVSWFDVVKWCNARSQKEGRTPAYYKDAALTQVYKAWQATPYVNWSAGYRLPTEAEWEKAARGGASGHRFPWSNIETITHSQANYNSSTSYAYDISPTRGYHPTFAVGGEPCTSPAGYFAANGYGLYDMAGNVREWCWDWYGPYASDAQTDARGPTSGSSRVRRGGAWHREASLCRAANRDYYDPLDRIFCVGFRSVLPPGQP